ncbi:MAG: DEAD/DEAH box helicase [Candidatus Sumerlaeaceae bacterium]|nr:DEAD/DEAH box helicase [Candidatus Sumerlaeaceae bacterium]
MNIEHLIAHGFAPRTLENWKQHYTERLLPLQAKVVAETSLLRGGNLIVFAPTSSGKTFVAEMAAMRHIEQGRKAVFLVPTKALAEEQYARLRRVYAPIGVRVAVATRERTAHDGDIIRGDFDLAVMVYEKLKTFLTVAPELIGRLGLVVVDELQILGDRQRGDVPDLLLAKIVQSGRGVQVLCLSAVLQENARLSAWLRCENFVWRERPIELREGVVRVSDGRFAYREFNSHAEAEEPLVEAGDKAAAESPETATDPYGPIEAVARELTGRGEQVLVFVPTKHLSRQWAFQLSVSLGLAAASPAVAELQSREESHSRALLEHCFEGAVAFHNADLPHDLRTLVEEEFNAGRLRVLVATSTLAQGVNLSGRNVISVPTMLENDSVTGQAAFAPLSCQRFRNQGGRGGRYSQGDPFARSMLVAADELEADRLMQQYVHGNVEQLEPPSDGAAMESMILDMVHCGVRGTIDGVTELLLATYTGMTTWAADLPGFAREVERAVERLADAALIRRKTGGELLPTGLGQAAAAFGLQLETARDFADYAREKGRMPISELEVLALCALSSDGCDFPLGVTPAEAAMQNFPAELAGRVDFNWDALPSSLGARLRPEGGFSEEEQSSLKKAFIAEAWISAATTSEIEEQFRVFAGTIANLGAHLAWLCHGLAACGAALGLCREQCEVISGIALRLPDGVEPRGLALAGLSVPGLSRNYIAILTRQGFDSIGALRTADFDTLSRYVPVTIGRRIAQAVQQEEHREAGPAHLFDWFSPKYHGETSEPMAAKARPRRAALETPDLLAAEVPVQPELKMDLSNPGVVVYRGCEILLPPLPYQLLALLARQPRRVVPYTEIDVALWPDAKVEQQQILAHKSAIIAQLGGISSPREARGLVKTVARHGLRLEMDPARVEFRDVTVAQLATA